MNNREIILLGPSKPLIVKGLEAIGTVHKSAEAKDLQSFYASHGDVRAIACRGAAPTAWFVAWGGLLFA